MLYIIQYIHITKDKAHNHCKIIEDFNNIHLENIEIKLFNNDLQHITDKSFFFGLSEYGGPYIKIS